MLRLLFVFLILRCAAATSEDTEGHASGYSDDDEDGDDVVTPVHFDAENAELDKSKGESEINADGTMIIIIAAASVVALAVIAVVAIVLFRRYLRSQEQGVYSMPAEQGQKAAV